MIKCPILESNIDEGLCVTVVDASEGCIKPDLLSKEITDNPRWKEICQRCQYHNN